MALPSLSRRLIFKPVTLLDVKGGGAVLPFDSKCLVESFFRIGPGPMVKQLQAFFKECAQIQYLRSDIFFEPDQFKKGDGN